MRKRKRKKVRGKYLKCGGKNKKQGQREDEKCGETGGKKGGELDLGKKDHNKLI